jgi:predicted alpha/beta superfamily hydrolase
MNNDQEAPQLNPEPQAARTNLEKAAPAQPSRETSGAPHPRLRLHRAFRSQFLPGDRDVIVYLPPNYHQQPEQTYPVLYMQDGQNLFDGQTSYIQGRTWAMREHADQAIEAGEVAPLVIVGIYNTGDRRLAEYTPDPDLQLGGGEAANYGRLLTEELMPWIATRYRVRTGREHTGIGGSSLGALVSLYLALRHPQHFGKLAILSPSVWWNRKSILSTLDERTPQIQERPQIWLDVGDQEGRPTLENAELLNQRLEANGWQPEKTLHFERVAGGAHDESSWARRVRPMLRFLFPGANTNMGEGKTVSAGKSGLGYTG